MVDTLPQVLHQAAAAFPEQQAVRCAGKSIDYAGLEQDSDALALQLLESGVGRADRVGIYCNKSIEAVLAMYGIMKAGAAYVPIDPFLPLLRVAHVLNDCGIGVLISAENKLAALQELQSQAALSLVVGVDPDSGLSTRCINWHTVTGQAKTATPVPAIAECDDLAYILYTSGSSGTPKGIMHTHGSALSFAAWAAAEYGLVSTDRVSNHAPFHFDLSIFDLYATAQAGATMVIVPESVSRFPVSVSQLLQDEAITVSYSVPFTLIQMLERGLLESRDLGALRQVLFAGEVFPTRYLRRLMELWPEKQFSNLYGPTETNVCACYHVEAALPDDDSAIPIGRACPDVRILIVDEGDNPVADGETGELLCNGGPVMRGYWNRPELDAKAFYHAPGDGDAAKRYYRTGDLVQQMPDGNLAYHGRKDRQVKSRGYRVELDEIETALMTHPGVQEAAVYAVPDTSGSNSIMAAVIRNGHRELEQKHLLQHIRTTLPPYALPSRIEFVDEFPRTSTGKVNRLELAGNKP